MESDFPSTLKVTKLGNILMVANYHGGYFRVLITGYWSRVGGGGLWSLHRRWNVIRDRSERSSVAQERLLGSSCSVHLRKTLGHNGGEEEGRAGED